MPSRDCPQLLTPSVSHFSEIICCFSAPFCSFVLNGPWDRCWSACRPWGCLMQMVVGVGSWAHCSSVLLGPKGVCRIPGPTLGPVVPGPSPARPVTCFYKASLGVFLCYTNKLKTSCLDGQVYQNWVWVTCVWRLLGLQFSSLVGNFCKEPSKLYKLNRTDCDSLFRPDSADSDPSQLAWCLVGLHVSEDISRQIPCSLLTHKCQPMKENVKFAMRLELQFRIFSHCVRTSEVCMLLCIISCIWSLLLVN